jgi:hypothetical protein
MDSKSQVPAYNENESNDPAPPSYSETISSRYPPSSSTSQYYSSQIQSQLSSLTSQISSLQTQKDILSHAHDEKILSLLTLDIQLYLTDFAKEGHLSSSRHKDWKMTKLYQSITTLRIPKNMTVLLELEIKRQTNMAMEICGTGEMKTWL